MGVALERASRCRRGRGIAVVAGAVALGLLVGPASAQPAPPLEPESEPPILEPPPQPPELPAGGAFDVTADSVEFESERSVYIARGNVHIVQKGRTLDADWVVFSNVTGLGVATGNVVVTEGSDVLHADMLHFEVRGMTGIVVRGELDTRENGFRVEGERMVRSGPSSYQVDEGRFTTCRCPEGEREPWALESSEAEIEVGGYATLRNSTFDVLGVPVLWLPWFRYPIKLERETGFLLPEFNQSSRNGFDVGVPFFWAARDNVNVTVTPRWLAKNGVKSDVELEYLFGERSRGYGFASVVPDDASISPGDPSTPFPKERWGGRWLHDQDLPWGWRGKVDAFAISDNLYPFDFRDLSDLRAERYAESLGFAERRFGKSDGVKVSAGVWFADDLQNPDDQDRDGFVLQRLPQVDVSALPKRLGPSWLSMDTSLTYFTSYSRATSAYPNASVVGDDLFLDTGIDAIPDGHERGASGFVEAGDANLDDGLGGTEGDGVFEEGEPLIDRGARLVLNPRAQLPFRLFDTVEVLPEVGYHGTLYQSDAQGFESRHLLTGNLDLRTRLRRVISLGSLSAIHLLEPRLTWTGVTAVNQDAKPFFVPRAFVQQERIRALEPTNLVRDAADRIEAVDAVTFALGNRLFAAPFGADVTQGRVLPELMADVTLAFHYDFEDDRFHDLFLDGIAYPWKNLITRFNIDWDFQRSEIQEGMLEVGYSDVRGNDLALSYRLVKNVPRFFENFAFDDQRFDKFKRGFVQIDQLALNSRVALSRRWAVTYDAAYSFEQSLVLSNRLGLEFLSRCECWAFRVEASDERSRGLNVGFRYRLLGIGDDRVRPFTGAGTGRGGGFSSF